MPPTTSRQAASMAMAITVDDNPLKTLIPFRKT